MSSKLKRLLFAIFFSVFISSNTSNISNNIGKFLLLIFQIKFSTKEILSNNTITDNYSRSENVKDYNKQLVEEIYLEGEETEAIKILEMNYKEFVDIIRTKHLLEFEKDILNKEIKRGESKEVAREYIKELVDLLKRFEDYFEKKRDTKLRKQTNIKGDI